MISEQLFKYSTMWLICMHKKVIIQLYHGSAHVCVLMQSLMLMHYHIIHAHEPWYN